MLHMQTFHDSSNNCRSFGTALFLVGFNIVNSQSLVCIKINSSYSDYSSMYSFFKIYLRMLHIYVFRDNTVNDSSLGIMSEL